jgi:hypothetical protein
MQDFPDFYGGSIDRICLSVNTIMAAINKARMLMLGWNCSSPRLLNEDLTGAFCMNMIPIRV